LRKLGREDAGVGRRGQVSAVAAAAEARVDDEHPEGRAAARERLLDLLESAER
jgi:hypothetical protein